MKQTKDKIEFKITKKVKFWLSLILCVIVVAVTATVLIVRANSLSSTKNTPQSSESSGGGNTSHPERNSATTDPLDQSVDLAASNTTSALVSLRNLGGIYQIWFGKYLTSNDVVSQTKLDLSSTNFTLLESCASNIVSTIQTEYTAAGKPLSADNVTDSDNLQTYINDFKELLNTIEK